MSPEELAALRARHDQMTGGDYGDVSKLLAHLDAVTAAVPLYDPDLRLFGLSTDELQRAIAVADFHDPQWRTRGRLEG